MPFDRDLLEEVEAPSQGGFNPSLLEEVGEEKVSPAEMSKVEKVADVAAANKPTAGQRWAMLQEPLIEGAQGMVGRLASPQQMVSDVVNAPGQLAAWYQRQRGLVPPDYVAPPVTPPLSPEQGKKVARFFSPFADPAKIGGVEQAFEEFGGETLSGLTSPEQVVPLLVGVKEPELVARFFQAQMIGDLPNTINQMIHGGTSVDQIKGALATLTSGGLPVAIERGLQRRPISPRIWESIGEEKPTIRTKGPADAVQREAAPILQPVQKQPVEGAREMPKPGGQPEAGERGEPLEEEKAPEPVQPGQRVLSSLAESTPKIVSHLRDLAHADWRSTIESYKSKYGEGSTALASDIGANVKTPADLAELLNAENDFRKASAKARADKNMGLAMQMTRRAHLFKEAIEAATRGEYIQKNKDPNYKPPLPFKDTDWQLTIYPRETLPDGKIFQIPSQMDYVPPDTKAAGGLHSTNAERLAALGFDVPSIEDLNKLPAGKYTLEEAKSKLAAPEENTPEQMAARAEEARTKQTAVTAPVKETPIQPARRETIIENARKIIPFGQRAVMQGTSDMQSADLMAALGHANIPVAERLEIVSGKKPFPTREQFEKGVDDAYWADGSSIAGRVWETMRMLGLKAEQSEAAIPQAKDFTSGKAYFRALSNLELRLNEAGGLEQAALIRSGTIPRPALPSKTAPPPAAAPAPEQKRASTETIADLQEKLRKAANADQKAQADAEAHEKTRPASFLTAADERDWQADKAELMRKSRLAKSAYETAASELSLADWRASVAGMKEPAPHPPLITGKVLKAQKEHLLSELDKSIKAAPEEHDEKNKITIEVPGDGTFTLLNNKESLKKFRDEAKKQFPSTVPSSGTPGLPTVRPRAMPPVAAPEPKDLGKIVVPAMSTDQSRFVLQTGYADGTQIVATDGRQLIRVVTGDAPGSPDAPVRINQEGKVDAKAAEEGGDYPNWKAVSSGDRTLLKGGLDTKDIFHIARQAQVFRDASSEKKENSPVTLWLNKDGTLGGTMDLKEEGEFEHNKQPGAVLIGGFNPDYLLNAASMARRLGNGSVDLYRMGTDKFAPVVIRGANHEHIIMPMRLEGETGESNNPAFLNMAGRPTHGSLPEGFGPLQDPMSARSRVVEKEGAGKYNLTLQGDTLKIEKHSRTSGGYGGRGAEDVWTEIAKPTLARLGKGAEAWRNNLFAILKEAKVENVAETRKSILEGFAALMKEREDIQAEAAQRRPKAPPASPGPQALGIAPPGTAAIQHVIDWMKGVPESARVFMSQLAGKSAPRTSAKSVASGNALIHFASSKIAAPQVAKSMATEVLGPHHKDAAFDVKFGFLGVEDRLRAIRDAAIKRGDQEAADDVTTIIGEKWSPFATEADFQAALADPEIQAAIARHKATVQPTAQAAHTSARGQLAGPGLNTGMFLNLKALFPEGADETVSPGTKRGNLENPLRRLTRFFKQAKGTADRYEGSYRVLAERMIQANFEEKSKRDMYAQLVRDGLAVIADPSAGRPEIGGKTPVKFTIERRGVTWADGRAHTFVKNIWVHPDIADEVGEALDTGRKPRKEWVIAAVNLLNRIQLAGPTDAVWHTANMLGSIAGSQGGKSLLIDLARKLPGVNIADTLGRVVASGIRVLRDTPEIQKQLAELAEIGALRGQHPANPLGRFIQFVDRAGRLVRDDLFKNLVQRGVVDYSEAERREWVNQMGQYNPRLMSQFQRFFKEAGFSPFVVAGRNFNRMAMRRMTLDPGIKAKSPAAAAEMRAVEAFGVLATLFAIPAVINYALTGSPGGRPGVQLGQIDTGKTDSKGKAIVIDPAQWTGLRRGLRISGVGAVVRGLREGEGPSRISRNVAHDIMAGVAHPWTGPGVTAASVAATGYDPRFYKESVNPNDYGENVQAALKQLNPVAAAIIRSHENKTSTGKELGLSLGGAAGVKADRLITPGQQMYRQARTFMEKSADPKIRERWRQMEEEAGRSPYNKLRSALESGDEAAAQQELESLLQSHERKNIVTAFRSAVTRPFTGSKATEARFFQSLSPAEREKYRTARKEQAETFRKFAEAWEKANAHSALDSD